MLGAQYSSTTLTNYFNDFFFSNQHMQYGSNRQHKLLYESIGIANYSLNSILTLKEKDLLSPSMLNG
jgi:hypothetical protein